MLFNKKFETIAGDKCILIKNPFDNKKVTLIYHNGESAFDCSEHLKNGKITEDDFKNEIHEALKKYI